MREPAMTCNLCGEHVPGIQVLDHLRILHPNEYGDGPLRWPDGSVVIDTSNVADPADFDGGDFPPELEGGTARLYAGLWMTAEHESRRYRAAWQSARRRAAAKEEQPT